MTYATPVVKLISDGLRAWIHHPLRSFTARSRLHSVRLAPLPSIAPNYRSEPFTTFSTEQDDSYGTSQRSHRGFRPNEGFGAISSRPRSAQQSLSNITSTNKWDVPYEMMLDLKSGNPSTATKDLYAILARLCIRGHLRESYDLVQYMLTKRNIKIDRNVFKLLITSNIAIEGSVAEVMNLMEQMRVEGIPLDQTVCQKILQVLAVHPDYVLRTAVLQKMEQNWQGLTEIDHHWVVAGLLRELQLERALEMLDKMNRNGLHVHAWLYDMTAYVLISLEEFEEALQVMRMRVEDKGPKMLTVLWTHLLDSAAEALHYDTCVYVWSRQVIPRYVVPSSGTCLKILCAAARHGDTALAKDIFLLLDERDTELDHQHYELVVEAYASAGDINGALGVVSEMNTIGIPTDQSTTRPIYRSLLLMHDELKQSKESVQSTEQIQNLILQAFREMEKLSQREVNVPLTAVNVLIEAAGKRQRLETAFYMYENLHLICPGGPDVETFYHLLEACRRSLRLDLATNLASAIANLGLKPDARLYDSLMLVSLSQTTYHDQHSTFLGFENAYRYYKEMTGLGLRPFQKTITLIYARLKDANDPRAEDVLQDVIRLFPVAETRPKREETVGDEKDDYSSERSEGRTIYLESAKASEH